MTTPSESAKPLIPLSVPVLSGNEWAYLKDCLDTGWVSSAGPHISRFEKTVAARLGMRHAVAVSSGTAALHLAMRVMGVTPGDIVIVSSLTFIAPANAVRYVGGHPVFMDAEPHHWQMDPEALQRYLSDGCVTRGNVLYDRLLGHPVRLLVPVHILGHPVDMAQMREIASQYNLPILEDASQGFGALCHNQPVGSLGDAACLSFNGNKTITTGGGGMFLTNHDDWARHAHYLANQAKDDPIEYIHQEIGYNYRMTSLQAALGLAQLEQMDAFLQAKRAIANRYRDALENIPGVDLQQEAPWADSAWWLSSIKVDPARFGLDARALMRALASENIQSRPLWQPMDMSPAHKDLTPWPCPVARDLWTNALSLPSSPDLSETDQERVCHAIRVMARLAR